MFDPEIGIEVQFAPFNSRDSYQEYKAPSSSDLYAPDRNECFIKAVTGERFQVKVSVHPLFAWKNEPNLRVKFVLNGFFRHYEHLSKPRGSCGDNRPTITPVVDTIVHTTGNRLQLCALEFRKVDIVDDPTFLSKDEEVAELRVRGKIEVTIIRGRASKSKVKSQTVECSEGVPIRDKTTKSIGSDHGRSHVVKPTPLMDYRPGDTCWNFTPASGHAAGEIKFTFYYTTRTYLEIQHIVPLITSPNTRETAITIDGKAPSHPPAQRSVPATPSKRPRQQLQDLTFVSARPAADADARPKRIKLEGGGYAELDDVKTNRESTPAPSKPADRQGISQPRDATSILDVKSAGQDDRIQRPTKMTKASLQREMAISKERLRLMDLEGQLAGIDEADEE